MTSEEAAKAVHSVNKRILESRNVLISIEVDTEEAALKIQEAVVLGEQLMNGIKASAIYFDCTALDQATIAKFNKLIDAINEIQGNS